MKYTWQPEDIKPGVRYTKGSAFTSWIIGYLPYPLRTDDRFVSISFVDGLVTGEHSRKELASILSKGGYVPGSSDK